MKKIVTGISVVLAVFVLLFCVGFVFSRLLPLDSATENNTSPLSGSSDTTASEKSADDLVTTEKETGPLTIKSDATTQKLTEATTTGFTTEKVTEDNKRYSVIDVLPLSFTSGSFDVKHCQGIAFDMYKGYMYYSYTNTFVKCDLEGNVVGTVTGIKGHIGDICLNKEDGRVYASYNPSGKKALYIAIFDVDNLNELNIEAEGSSVMRTVHLKEVYKDFSARVTHGEKKYKRRYGVSGTDGCCFGPSFSTGKGNYLTISCGITPQPERKDNDYQILLQYNVKDWWDTYSQPVNFSEYHHTGPDKHNGKYFIYTGNTTYGVQTMTYFEEMNLWILNVYVTKKDSFPKYNMFIVDGDVKPRKELIRGQTEPEEQYVLSLYQDGEYHKKTGIYGWYTSYGSKGMDYVDGGLFYIVHPYLTWYKKQTAVAYLYVWDDRAKEPFTLAAGVDTDYEPGEKKKYVPTTTKPTTTKPTTTAPTTTAPDKPAFSLDDVFGLLN